MKPKPIHLRRWRVELLSGGKVIHTVEVLGDRPMMAARHAVRLLKDQGLEVDGLNAIEIGKPPA